MSIVNVYYPIGCFGDGMEKSIAQSLVRNTIKNK
ncbi:hypothetical protein XO27_0022 [Bacillus phage phi4I1]|uniref:Uncharacterized protein n=2 Tax=Camtrevirus BtCS33 TaxID=2843759 RepID=A0A2I6UF31_9CAUD|nr:hypothetical protein XO27_0022 [Bacillus phage phi4I1]AUO78584.1 hypothetical protein XO27_0022 [Bacillus phage BtiUFT6.51-F]